MEIEIVYCAKFERSPFCNIIKDGSKLGFQSDFLKATVRNKTTDSEIKPSLHDLLSMTSSKLHQNTCPVKFATTYQGINEKASSI